MPAAMSQALAISNFPIFQSSLRDWILFFANKSPALTCWAIFVPSLRDLSNFRSLISKSLAINARRGSFHYTGAPSGMEGRFNAKLRNLN